MTFHKDLFTMTMHRFNFMRLRLIPALLLCAIICSCDRSDPNDPAVKLQAIVDEFIGDQKEILGAMARIDLADQGSYKAAAGFANLFKNTGLRPDDKFLIGSITKMFTATLVHQLIEDGSIGLEDRIINHLPPDWASVLGQVEYGPDITVYQALCHRSGIYDTPSSSEFFARMIANPSARIDPLFMLEMARDGFKANFKPGESFAYSSLNYILLGKLVEGVTKKPYETVLSEKIINKIGLTNTYLSKGKFGSGLDGIAHGYMQIEGRVYDGQEFDSGWAWSAGAIISNNDDLVRFAKALASGRLFQKEDTFRKMCELPERNREYGLGVIVLQDGQLGEYYVHAGFFGGTSSILCHFPLENATISVCINFDGTRSQLKAIDLMDLIILKMMKSLV